MGRLERNSQPNYDLQIEQRDGRVHHFSVDLHFKIMKWMSVENTPKGQIGKHLACMWILESDPFLLALGPPLQSAVDIVRAGTSLFP